MPFFPFSIRLIKLAEKHNYIKKKKEESGNITYIYDEKHIKERNKKKAQKLSKLAKSLHKVRKQVKKDINHTDPKISLPALAVALIDETYERVGNRYSAADLKHYGVTTWLVKHIKFSNSSATISYVGKAGVKQKKTISSKLASKLKTLCKGKKPSDNIFQIDDYTLNDNLVNQYLRPFNITAKDIRGLHANREVKEHLKKIRKGKLPTDEKEKTKQLKDEFKTAVEEVSKMVGHKPSTLKNQYLIPGFEEKYVSKGEIIGPKVAQFNFSISKRSEKEDDDYFTDMSEEEELAYKKYWEDLAKKIENKPKRKLSEMTGDEIEMLAEMDTEEREEYINHHFIRKSSFSISKRASNLWIKPSFQDELPEFLRVAEEENISLDSLKRSFSNGILIPLDKSLWKQIENTDSLTPIFLEDAITLAKSYDKNYSPILSALQSHSPLPAPIVLQKDNNSFTLIAGNTRLSFAKVLHIKPYIFLIQETQLFKSPHSLN